jgi:hypothetical protein
MTPSTETAAPYFITTPYIDAYEHDYRPVAGLSGKPMLTFEQFELRMKAQAYSWGEQGIGRALLSGVEPAMHDGRYVLAFGTWDGKSYLAVSGNGGTMYDSEVVEGESEPEWNVT